MKTMQLTIEGRCYRCGLMAITLDKMHILGIFADIKPSICALGYRKPCMQVYIVQQCRLHIFILTELFYCLCLFTIVAA